MPNTWQQQYIPEIVNEYKDAIKVSAHPGESTDEVQRLLTEKSSRESPRVLRRKESPTRAQHKAGVSEL